MDKILTAEIKDSVYAKTLKHGSTIAVKYSESQG